MLLRNGEQLLLAFAIPLGLVIGGLLWGRQFGLDGNTFPASVIAVAVWSTAFTSLGVATGFERRYGVLERLVATPLTRADLIAGKALAACALVAIQAVLLLAVALGLGWRARPEPGGGAQRHDGHPAADASRAGAAAGRHAQGRGDARPGQPDLLGRAGPGRADRRPTPWLPTAALGSTAKPGAPGSHSTAQESRRVGGRPTLTARRFFRWTS